MWLSKHATFIFVTYKVAVWISMLGCYVMLPRFGHLLWSTTVKPCERKEVSRLVEVTV